MSDPVQWVLLVLLGLQVKHLLADYVLQTPRMLESKGIYGDPGGLAHAAIHGVLTGGVLLLGGLGGAAAVLLGLAEAVLHYHIDWGKDRVVAWAGLTPEQSGYWAAMGVDQFLHQVTYLALVWSALTVT